MAEDSGQTVVAALIDHILPLVPGLTDLLKAGIDVLDVGCGSGRALNLMAETFANSRFVGCDLSPEAIAAGTRQAQERGLANVRFEVKDLGVAEIQGQYDLITAACSSCRTSPARVTSRTTSTIRLVRFSTRFHACTA
jgi:SAM-dependent methyltransferase